MFTQKIKSPHKVIVITIPGIKSIWILQTLLQYMQHNKEPFTPKSNIKRKIQTIQSLPTQFINLRNKMNEKSGANLVIEPTVGWMVGLLPFESLDKVANQHLWLIRSPNPLHPHISTWNYPSLDSDSKPLLQ